MGKLGYKGKSTNNEATGCLGRIKRSQYSWFGRDL